MVGIFYACFRQNTYLCTLNDKRMNKRIACLGWIAALILLIGCQPKTDLDKIDALKKQVNKDLKTLNDLNDNSFVQLEKDFIYCDSSLQFLPEKELDAVFPKLQLVDAYIQQFKETRPVMQAEMDSTLARLDLLRADAATHYLADSLVATYVEDETQQVERLSSQVAYFKDRFDNCRKELEGFKKKK